MNFRQSIRDIKATSTEDDRFLEALTSAMQVWIVMNIIFGLASFGFSSYEWYLFAGLSVVLKRIVEKKKQETVEPEEPEPEQDPGFIYPGPYQV